MNPSPLQELDLPTLVVHGTVDPLVPVEGGKDTAEAIPGAVLMLIEGMGHDMPKAVHSRIVDGINHLVAGSAA